MAFLLLALIVAFAFVIETAVGFGATVVSVSLAAHLYPIDRLVVMLVPINLLVSLYLVGRYRAHVAWPLFFRRILPLVGVGMAAGMAVFHGANHGWLKPLFGAFVCGIAALELVGGLYRKGVARPLSRAAGAAWLVAGGTIHGIFATGGPLVVYFLGRELTDKAAFRATLSLLWLVLNLVLSVSYALSGRLEAETLGMSAALLGPMGVGMLLGERLHHGLDARRFRTFVFGMLFVAGAALLWSARRG